MLTLSNEILLKRKKQKKHDIILRSKDLIKAIHSIANSQITKLQNYRKGHNRRNSIEQFQFAEDNLEIEEKDLNEFIKTADEFLTMFVNGKNILSRAAVKIAQRNSQEIVEKHDFLTDYEAEVKEFKAELLKNHLKIREETIKKTKEIMINTNCNTKNLKKELEEDYKLFIQSHTSNVTCLAATSDGKYLISGSDDNTIRIWNTITKRQKAILTGHSAGILSLAISKDNNYIISSSMDNTIRFWSLLDYTQEFILNEQTSLVNSIVITNDDKYIIFGCNDGAISIWYYLERTQYSQLNKHNSRVTSIVTTSNYKYIYSSYQDGAIKEWNFSDRTIKRDLINHSLCINCLAISNENILFMVAIMQFAFLTSLKWEEKNH